MISQRRATSFETSVCPSIPNRRIRDLLRIKTRTGWVFPRARPLGGVWKGLSRNPGLWTSRSAVMSSVGKTGGVGRSRARLTTRRTLHAALSSFPTRARGPKAAKWALDPRSAMDVDDEHPMPPVPGSSPSLLAQREYACLQRSQVSELRAAGSRAGGFRLATIFSPASAVPNRTPLF